MQIYKDQLEEEDAVLVVKICTFDKTNKIMPVKFIE